MYILKKLYPRNGADSYLTTTSLIFIAEGYTAAQETQFYRDVDQAFQRMLDYHSLINLRLENNSISVYTLFLPSSQSGIAASATEAINRTPFESYLSNGLHLNYNKVKDVLEDTYFSDNLDNMENKLSDRLTTNQDTNRALFSKKAIPIFIFPYIASQIGEVENLTTNQYYYTATTLDSWYEQIILRSLFKVLGLGDEFDLLGVDYSEPDEENGQILNFLYPNLYYTTNSNQITPLSPDFKWASYFTSFDTNVIPVHPHPSNGDNINRLLPEIPYSYKSIELWEGGGGFRKNVYRSAEDCLLRRRIGDSSLPVKSTKISLCPICEFYLRNNISR